MIAEVEAEQAAALDAEEGQAARLIRLRGIGLVSATVLADEVFFRDFRNRREVAGYLGLVSSPWASGRVQRDQGITKSGDPAPDEPRSNSPGCGCGISQAAS
jgi:transposase